MVHGASLKSYKMDDSPDSLEVEMGESLRMAEARRLRRKTKHDRETTTKKVVSKSVSKDTISPLQDSSESPSNNKDSAVTTKSLPSIFLWPFGKNIANKVGKNVKDLLGCLGLDDEKDVVDPRTVRKLVNQHHRSHGHHPQQSIPKDPQTPFSFPPCPALTSDQPWASDPLLIANKDALWMVFYHFSDSIDQKEPYITMPKLQQLLSVCGVYPALVTSRDLATIFAEGVGGKVRLDTDCLSFVDFVEVLWQIAERALIIIPERQDTTAHNNMRLAMLLHLMETHCDGKLPPFDLHLLEEQRTKAAVRKRIEKTTADHEEVTSNNRSHKKETTRHFLEEFASGICGFDDSSDSS